MDNGWLMDVLWGRDGTISFFYLFLSLHRIFEDLGRKHFKVAKYSMPCLFGFGGDSCNSSVVGNSTRCTNNCKLIALFTIKPNFLSS
jgi:hypothetical protein